MVAAQTTLGKAASWPMAGLLLLSIVSSFATATNAASNELHSREIPSYGPRQGERPPSTLQDCLAQSGAGVLQPSSNGYASTTSQNTNYAYKPSVIVQPTNAEQVSKVVRCVAKEGGKVKLSSFGGGHGYASCAYFHSPATLEPHYDTNASHT